MEHRWDNAKRLSDLGATNDCIRQEGFFGSITPFIFMYSFEKKDEFRTYSRNDSRMRKINEYSIGRAKTLFRKKNKQIGTKLREINVLNSIFIYCF